MRARRMAAPLFALLIPTALLLWTLPLLSEKRQVLVISDPYWDRLLWEEEAAAERLAVSLLNLWSRPRFLTLPGGAGRQELLRALTRHEAAAVLLSPRFSRWAKEAARRVPEARVIGWAAAAPGPQEEMPANLSLIYPDLRDAFYQAGKREAQAAASVSPAGTIVHLHHESGFAGRREMAALRRGIREAGWDGGVEDIRWPEAEGEQRRSVSSLIVPPERSEEEETPEGKAPEGKTAPLRVSPGDTVFLGVYTGAAAEALRTAHRYRIPAAAAVGREMGRAYPEMVRFTLRLRQYEALREVCTAAVRGLQPSAAVAARGEIVVD